MRKILVRILDFIVWLGVLLLIAVGLIVLAPFYSLRVLIQPDFTDFKKEKAGCFSPSTDKTM